jgi:HEAT repeat protein
MTDDASPENLRKFLESDDPALRRMGLSMAKGMKVPDSYKLVMALSLWDSEEGNREAAAELVEEIGLENITEFPGWLEPFDGRVAEEVCKAAVEALGKIGDTRAVEPLIEALGDANDYVRASATEALDKVGWVPETDEQRAAYLIAVLDWGSLVEWGEPAVEPLIKAFGNDLVNQRAGRHEFAELLGKIGDARAVEPLIKALGDDEYIGRSAAYALGDIGDIRAVEPLIKALREDSHHLVGGAASALGNIGDERAVEPLILLALRTSRVSRSLSSRFPRRYDEIREAVTGVLVNFGEPAVEPLIEALVDEDEDVRSYAAEALKAIGGPRAMEVLAKLLEDPEQFRIEALIEALVNDDEFISNDALVPLIGIGEPAVESLIEWADDLLNCGPYGDNTDEGWGLWQIANALEGIGDARAVEVLIKIMSDGYACDGAVDALISIGKPAVEPLIKALGDEDDDVRQAAKEALRKLGHEEAAADLHPLHDFFEVEGK